MLKHVKIQTNDRDVISLTDEVKAYVEGSGVCYDGANHTVVVAVSVSVAGGGAFSASHVYLCAVDRCIAVALYTSARGRRSRAVTVAFSAHDRIVRVIA